MTILLPNRTGAVSGFETDKDLASSLESSPFSEDEKVQGVDHLMKYNDENIQKQQSLCKRQDIDKNTKPGLVSQFKPRSSNGKGCHIFGKACESPNSTNSKEATDRVADSVGEILKGLLCYFDKALPVMLLYNSERKQYEEIISDYVSPSTVYGTEHLLRLFVKLLELLVHLKLRRH